MIITIAPFPSIEYIYEVDTLEPNCKHSSKQVSLNIVSKGVYSTQVMKILQEEPILLSAMGGFVGKYIKHYLDKSKVKSDIVWTDYETPHGMKVIVEASKDYYLLQHQDTYASEKEVLKLTQKLKQHIKKVSTLVLAGELPQEVNPVVYKEWIKEAKKHNVKVIVSTGQAAVLDYVLEERPYGLMFTLDQLKTLNFPIDSPLIITESLVPLLNKGVHYICVYLKQDGALVLSKNKYCLVEAPLEAISKHNMAASGAFLGAFAIGVNRKYEQEKFAKLCLSAALVANDNINVAICTKKEIDCHLRKTKVKEIHLS